MLHATYQSYLFIFRLNNQIAVAPLQLEISFPRLTEPVLETEGPSQSVLLLDKVCEEGEVITLREECISMNVMVA
jgi:hypothetical protein